jgi:hypothetical protein
MKKHEIKQSLKNLVKTLETQLADVERMWEDKSESHAYMVGYLIGTINHTISQLKEKGGKA